MYVYMIDTYIYIYRFIYCTHMHTYICMCIYIYTPLKFNMEPWKKPPLPNPFAVLPSKTTLFFSVGFFRASRAFGTQDFRPEYDMQPWEGQHSQEEWKSEHLKLWSVNSIFLVTENTSFGPPKRLAENPGNLVILGKIRLVKYYNLAR